VVEAADGIGVVGRGRAALPGAARRHVDAHASIELGDLPRRFRGRHRARRRRDGDAQDEEKDERDAARC
jgi:hypothetical protein